MKLFYLVSLIQYRKKGMLCLKYGFTYSVFAKQQVNKTT